ncbi:S-adenosyl-L-methionine-dependent methyltransferase [Colletotrichum sublineola]|nr:S-adenosyl-L-methionine-dependent methyltransferase [Colletotrichum sublineola]
MSEEDRAEALQATYEAISILESPWETYVRLYMNTPSVIAGLKVIKDLKLMARWHEKGNVPMTSVELAELVGAVILSFSVNRFLRLLTANGFLKQGPMEKFKPTQFCIELSNPDFNTVIDFYMWSYLKENPKAGEIFNILQKVSTTKELVLVEMYPHQKLVDGSDPNSPLLVDIGGGIGQDILRFYTTYPEEASRIYLEDLPEVIADGHQKSIVPNTVNKVEYNFFTPQPIKSARAYFMHHIIHDWPDASAQKILEMQKISMKPGYSRLLIYDHVLDDEKGFLGPASFDIGMMMCLAGPL